ncbi:proteasome subunit beta type 1 [Reticulomyxa filosa]|uniref:Proteasome subunit beta n=1 Tax=Reticulomyxa filosa TaxID=46433 RepID=X6NGE5_RETFI|nr:proteasome subunit beta type 1 [Reticulomyxa filosa]|eukprot:ETO24968.1 proteasome subunit beta type 1 [Reticulomyxa filosa]
MSRWGPYVDNGGKTEEMTKLIFLFRTAVAVAGTGFAIIAADRRLSTDYNILSREVDKLVKLTSKTVLGSCGMQSDRNTLHSILKSRMHDYQINHEKEMSTHAISEILFLKKKNERFEHYPFECIFMSLFFLLSDTFNVLAGIDEKGEGYVYSYDAIGSFEANKHGATGSGTELAVPMLDNILDKQHQSKADKNEKLTKEKALELVQDVLNAVVERDIKTGDGADIYIITPEGCEKKFMPLRKD